MSFLGWFHQMRTIFNPNSIWAKKKYFPNQKGWNFGGWFFEWKASLPPLPASILVVGGRDWCESVSGIPFGASQKQMKCQVCHVKVHDERLVVRVRVVLLQPVRHPHRQVPFFLIPYFCNKEPVGVESCSPLTQGSRSPSLIKKPCQPHPKYLQVEKAIASFTSGGDDKKPEKDMAGRGVLIN